MVFRLPKDFQEIEKLPVHVGLVYSNLLISNNLETDPFTAKSRFILSKFESKTLIFDNETKTLYIPCNLPGFVQALQKVTEIFKKSGIDANVCIGAFVDSTSSMFFYRIKTEFEVLTEMESSTED